jgi:hypothetical protein
MAIEAIGGVSSTANTQAINRAEEPSGAARARAPESKDSTIVISRVTRTKEDGSTETIITYADGHTKIETTPPKFSAEESQGGQGNGGQSNGGQSDGSGAGGTQAKLSPGEGRVTAVDILA